jgi:uncharacterized repeat protein (TIGR01451 family)
MNNKIFLLAVVLVLSMGVVSAAYDLSVDSISASANPTVGEQTEFTIEVTNNGPDNITGENIDILVTFDDGSDFTIPLTNLEAQTTTTLDTFNTYTNGGDYTVTAEASNMANDSNAANNEASTTISANTVPSITAIPDQSATVGVAFSYQVNAQDADSDSLTYSISGAPAGMTISSTGLISWTPTTTTNANSVTVTVADGQASETESFAISANNAGADLTSSANTIKLGGNSAERNTQVSTSYTVTNSGSEQISNLAAAFTNSQGNALSSDFNAQATISQNTLNVGESATVTAIATIPANKNSQESTIGQVRVTGTGASSIQITETTFVTMQAESKLRITDVELEVNNDDEGDLDDGDNYDELKEGDEITLTITIENLYSDNDDIDINDVYIEVEDDEWDIDEESDEEDISADSDEEFTITFTIDDDLDEDETEVTIRVYGEDDEFDFEHYDEITFDFGIDREDDEISISSINWDQSTVSCNNAYATLNVRIKNTGTDDQDEAAIFVDASELDFTRRILNIELDEGDSETQEFRIPLQGVEAGSYFVEVNTYYRNERRSDQEVVPLTVTCNEPTTPTTPTNPTTPSNPGDGIVIVSPGNTGGGTAQPTPTTQEPTYGERVTAQIKANDDLYLIGLAVIVLLLLIAVIALAVKILK